MEFSHLVLLSDLEPVALGGRRAVYVFPDKPDWLTKVAIPDRTPQAQSIHRSLLSRFFPDLVYKPILREIESELKTALKIGLAISESPLARCMGIVQTDLGPGVVIEKISGKDSDVAPTLLSMSKAGQLTKPIIDELNEFSEKLFKLQVVTSDINLGNIVYGQRDGTQAFFLVDGFWERNFIPVRSLFYSVNVYQLKKRLQKTAFKTGLRWDNKTAKFHLPPD